MTPRLQRAAASDEGLHSPNCLASVAMQRLLELYAGWLDRAPLLTKCITSGVLFGTGDRIAQRLERYAIEQDEACDAKLAPLSGQESVKRTLRMIIWGGVLFAPMAHSWYNVVDRTVRATGAIGVTKKIAMDQLLFTPVVTTIFFTTMQCMESKPPSEALGIAIAKLPPTLEMNYRVWPFVHLVTFNFVPLQYRVLFINCVNIGWSAFLSGMSSQNHSSSKEESGREEEVASVMLLSKAVK